MRFLPISMEPSLIPIKLENVHRCGPQPCPRARENWELWLAHGICGDRGKVQPSPIDLQRYDPSDWATSGCMHPDTVYVRRGQTKLRLELDGGGPALLPRSYMFRSINGQFTRKDLVDMIYETLGDQRMFYALQRIAYDPERNEVLGTLSQNHF